MYFKDNTINDCIENRNYPYKEIKGFSHIWGYFKTIEGNFLGSIYRREKHNASIISTITCTPDGWRVHLWKTGGMIGKSYWEYFEYLDDAVELCNWFIEGKFEIE